MLDLNLTREDSEDAANAILRSLKQEIGGAQRDRREFTSLSETLEMRESSDSAVQLFGAFLTYTDKMPERISRGIPLEVLRETAEEFLIGVKALANSVLGALRAFRDSAIEWIVRIKDYVISIASKIWSIFSILFKSLREFTIEIGLGGDMSPFQGKIGLVFDNPLR